MTLKAVIFDLDQTLIDSKDAHLAALVDSLEREGWSTKVDWVYGLTTEGMVKHSFPKIPDEILEKVVERKRHVLKNYLSKIKVLPGARELLNYLKKKGIKLILITNNTHREIAVLLEQIELTGYFDVVVGREDAQPKPSPHPIIKAIQDINPPLEETIYIGDSDPDIEAAKAAGIRMMLVIACHDTATLKSKADWVVSNLVEALRTVKELLET